MLESLSGRDPFAAKLYLLLDDFFHRIWHAEFPEKRARLGTQRHYRA
jgi:hypothetical protein